MLVQIILNTLASAGLIALVAVGFSVIYSTVRFFHFAHGAVFTVSGYAFFWLITSGHLSPWAGVPIAVAMGGILGVLTELAVYRPLRCHDASGLVFLLASLGMFIVLENLVILGFGEETRVMRGGSVAEGLHVLGGHVTLVQLYTIVSSAILCSSTAFLLRFTQVGRIIRAVANDAELAKCVGVDIDSIILLVFGVGSALAAIAAILMGYDVGLSPTMGFSVLLLGVVAAVVGGMGSVSGAVFGALLISAAQNFTAWCLPTQWQDAITFLILVVFLVLRPQGFFGKPLRKAAI